ncbi:uncharacterized protein At4g26485-like isoform X2 [Tasmannia lanceolata]|uniref:uncharacterized protein At4g26485-like isoform X2 n=1 Tax=Tasmannia lanceolata TaxID=3420 RepID=UPI004063865F
MGQVFCDFLSHTTERSKEEVKSGLSEARQCYQVVEKRVKPRTFGDLTNKGWRKKVEKHYNNFPAYTTEPKFEKEEKWIKHYSSSHQILLVGEGDFSFSACLALAFGSAINMVSTSLDSLEFLRNNYLRALSNIDLLKRSGCKVIHGVDATDMVDHYYLKGMKFDRIVFNFPHAGFKRNESRITQIKRHQNLLLPFFKNAAQMITKEGEIHVPHKSNGFHLQWRLDEMAYQSGLDLKQEEEFHLSHYPGYNNKYGFGGDKNFDWIPSKTYKFKLRSSPVWLQKVGKTAEHF